MQKKKRKIQRLHVVVIREIEYSLRGLEKGSVKKR